MEAVDLPLSLIIIPPATASYRLACHRTDSLDDN
jgi:hypothetical protein